MSTVAEAVRFQVRTAAQICAESDERDAQFDEQIRTHKPSDPWDAELLGHLDNESQLGEIADIKNCDLEDVRTWERGLMESARKYAEDLINTAVAKSIVDVPRLEIARRLRIVEAADYAGSYDDEGQSWLIDSLIPVRGVGMIWGASGSHKTGVALDLLAAVHSGTPWRSKAVTRGRGVLVLGEGQFFFKNRLRAYSKWHNVAMGSMPAVVLSPVNLRDAQQVAIFAQELMKLGASQVWFDTLQQNSAGADGNSDKDMGEVISNMKWLSDKINGFVGVLHHEGKSGHDRGPRGSSVWRPALDVELYVECPDGMNGTVHCEKLKDGPPNSVYPFKREIVGLDRIENGRPVSSVVVVQTDDAPLTRGPKLPKAGTKERVALDAIKALIAKAGGPVSLEDARETLIATKSEPEPGTKDRRAARATEEIDALKRKEMLFSVNGRLSDSRLIVGDADAGF